MFNVKAPVDGDGNELACTEASINMGLVACVSRVSAAFLLFVANIIGLTSHPVHYSYRFEPRHPDAVATFEEHKSLVDL